MENNEFEKMLHEILDKLSKMEKHQEPELPYESEVTKELKGNGPNQLFADER